MDISFIIVNWNNLNDTLACIDSVRQSTYPNLSIIVVDNASTDGSGKELSGILPQENFLQMNSNLGFTGGNNAGIRLAISRKVKYILLLNNDAIIAEDAIEKLTTLLETSPNVSVTTPMIYYHSQPGRIWSAGGEIDPRRAKASMLGTDEIDQGQFDNIPYRVDFASGCALMTRIETIEKAGLLDERFFMYFDEAEWCQRLGSMGQTIMLLPDAKVWHKIQPDQRNLSPLVYYLMTRNRLLWIRCAGFGLFVFWRVLLLESMRMALIWTIGPRRKTRRNLRNAIILGIRDYYKKRFGPPPAEILCGRMGKNVL